MNVLVTGGAGYIGSHAALRMLEDGHAVTVVDDLSRGNRGAIDALQPLGDLHFARGSFGDEPMMIDLLRDRRIDLVMHFAALAYVGESVQQPIRYYRNNTANVINLLSAMNEVGVGRIVFSSTCATYGEPGEAHIPISEKCPQHPINPYGRSKLFVERILADNLRGQQLAGKAFAYAALRYFNVAGADVQGRIGEDHDPETHLIPICLQAALGQREHITIFGEDYPTPDGTCIRDYVHVNDLIDAHVAVMDTLQPGDELAFNIGIGRGYSVHEVIQACKRVTGVDFTCVPGPRREGDPPVLFAESSKIHRELNWQAQHTDFDTIVESAWGWHRDHPHGYRSA